MAGSEARLLDEWSASPVSLREVADACGVSHTTAMRWKRGETSVPGSHRSALVELLAARDPEAEIRKVLSAHPEGVTVRQLEAQLSGGRARRILRDQLARGDLRTSVVDLPRKDGKVYESLVVLPGRSSPPPDPAQRRPEVPGVALRHARRRRGLSSVELAASAGLAPGTIRSLEARPTVPAGRVADLTSALGTALSGADVRRIRTAAGWSLSELASRVGVTIATLQAWEVGRRPIPVGRRILLEGALGEAQASGTAEAKRLEALEAKIAGYGSEGISEAELRHGLRRRSGSARVGAPNLDRELGLLIRKGRVVKRRVAQPDRLGRPKERVVLIHSHAAPLREIEHRMTGDDLLEARGRLGRTQLEVAQEVGAHQSEINRLEHMHGHELPAHWTVRLRKALAELAARGTRDEQLSSVIRAELVRAPGIPRWRLLDAVGHGKDAVRVLAKLIESGQVRLDAAWDNQGRPFRGLYPSGMPSAAGELTPRQLRSLRERAGWSVSQLADALGVGQNTVTRWEAGTRHCQPATVERIRVVLRDEAPEPRALTERRALLLELAGQPGGVTLTELPAKLRGAAGRRMIAELLADGDLEESERLETVADGRSYRRSVLTLSGTSAPLRSMNGRELAERRTEAGISQSALARALGISPSAVQRWETRGSVPVGRVADVESVLRECT